MAREVTGDVLKRLDRLVARTEAPVAEATLEAPGVTLLICPWREGEQFLDRRVRESATAVCAQPIGDPVVAGFDVPAWDVAAPRMGRVDDQGPHPCLCPSENAAALPGD